MKQLRLRPRLDWKRLFSVDDLARCAEQRVQPGLCRCLCVHSPGRFGHLPYVGECDRQQLRHSVLGPQFPGRPCHEFQPNRPYVYRDDAFPVMAHEIDVKR